ncbi:MAG TPA: UDP-N-acetylmuramoylalanyl-D-glutamyl-2, 6-diaminopimelate--D-alanyl-D-alanine ligase, partial [Phaeodactylibacter sp.]|nr:UDP-N-acetylmuramoylalanyl-D-glutamyl-2, 6-diaminopimelate--D-alanyl-D-alanine ligase [Phaeodactylibacter sp.]
TAIVVARFFKIPSEKIQQAIENYFPQNNRSQLIEIKNNTYLLDAYNANPESMKQALTYFAQMPATRRIAILGDMLELGDYSEKEHNTILQLAVDLGLHKIWLVGDAFAKTIHQSEKIKRFGNVYELKRWYQGQQESNTHFLLKGSRGIELEKFILEEGKS